MDTLVVPGPRGPIFCKKDGLVVLPTEELSYVEIAMAVNFLRWGCHGVQFLFPQEQTSGDLKTHCEKINAICKSLAIGKEEFGSFHDKEDGSNSISLGVQNCFVPHARTHK